MKQLLPKISRLFVLVQKLMTQENRTKFRKYIENLALRQYIIPFCILTVAIFLIPTNLIADNSFTSQNHNLSNTESNSKNLIVGTWKRIESNASNLDGIEVIVTDNNKVGKIIYSPISSFSVGDLKWMDIVKVSEYEYQYSDRSTSGSYNKNKYIYIIASGNELVLGDFNDSYGGSFQRWIRIDTTYIEDTDYNLIGLWQRTKSNNSKLDSMRVLVDAVQQEGIIVYSPDESSFPIGQQKWKNIKKTGKNRYSIESSLSSSKYSESRMFVTAGGNEVIIGNFMTDAGSFQKWTNKDPKAKGIYKIAPSKAFIKQDTITIKVLGNKFNSASTVKFIRDDGYTNSPIETILVDSLDLKIKLDLKNMFVGNYDLIVINQPNDTLRLNNCFQLLDQELIPFDKWVTFKAKYGNSFFSAVEIPAIEKLFVFVRKSNRTGYASTWKGKLKVMQDGEIISQQTDGEKYGGNVIGGSYSDFALQIDNPSNNLYTFEIEDFKSEIQGDGEIMFTSMPPKLTLNEWGKGTVLRAYGSDWKTVVIPNNTEKFTIQTEGMGLWSTVDVYYEDINQTSKHWQFSNMGEGYTIKGTIKSPKAGVYYIKYMDSAVLQKDGSDNLYNHADDQTRSYMIYAGTTSTVPTSSSPLFIENLSTYTVGQGMVTIGITGTGFSESDIIKLVNSKKEFIAETVCRDNRNTAGVFDLSSADSGKYELQVINKRKEQAASSSKVTVESANENSGLWTQIIGRDKVRVGRKQKYLIRYGNNSNVDIEKVALAVIIPSKFVDSIYVDKFVIDSSTGQNSNVKQDTTFFYIPYLPANSHNDFEFQISTTSNTDKVLDISVYIFPLIGNSTLKSKQISTSSDVALINDSQIEGLKDGDIVYMKFAPVNEAIHAGIYFENIDPYSTGKSGNYVIELDNKGLMKANQWEGWGKIAGVDNYAGNARPIDDNNINKSQLISDLKTNIKNDFKAHNNKEYQKYNYDITSRIENNDLSRGHCGDLVNDLYSQVGVDIPGFNNWPYEQMLEYQKQGKLNAMPGYDKFKHDLGNTAKARLLETAHLKKLGDNLISFIANLVNSTTPEDKYGPIGASVSISDSTAIHYIDTSKVFEYRVDYWNKEDATAPAAAVYIRDTLDVDFNLQTLDFTEVGFLKWKVKLEGGQFFNVNVDCRPDMPYIVNIEGTVDPETREVYWVHTTLDPETMELPEDPLSGYLPPIDSTGYQIGWVSYTIKANPNLPDGTVFTNQAHVNFDGVGKWGPAPKEGPYTNIFDMSSPTSNVLELPKTVNSDSVLVQWQGEDTGCGLITYTIYVSTNGSEFTPWLTTNNTEALFKGEFGNSYSFYSLSTDGVGNKEAIKTLAEATTKLVGQNFTVTITKKWNDVLICNNTDNKFTNYQWFKNEIAINGATSQFFQENGELNGSYYVQVTTTDGKIGISNVISVGNNTKSVKVYPNPLDERKEYTVEIKAEESELTSGEMIVTNVNGQIISRRKQLQPLNKLDGLSRGVYLVKVQFANGESFNEKLIVK